MSPYDVGYTLPIGLSRHLAGFGNVGQCPVTRAAFRLARDHLQSCFREEEEAARRLDEARRGTERLYLVAPWAAPRLLDENLPWNRVPRDKQDLEATERRLAGFGFRAVADGAVVTYRLLHEGCDMFADPRAAGRIDFVVCREGARSWRAGHQGFHMLDHWKDYGGKFAMRLAGAVEALAASRVRRGPRSG